jgi:serine/threonine protein phosphatase PrpC
VATIVPRFDFRVDCAAAEDIGKTRGRHEDACAIAPEIGVFVVADGMGGHPAGDVASRLAVDEVTKTLGDSTSIRILERYVNRPDLPARRNVYARLKRAIERANDAVRKDAAENEQRRGMGTTIDVLWLARNHAFVAHAGDGRVYLARRRAMLQLTQDHGHLEALKASGEVRPAKQSPRNALVNAVGIADAVTVDALFVDLQRGDRLLLCTDGVHGQIRSETRLTQVLRSGTVRQAAAALVSEAGHKGFDNATAVVIEIGDRFVKRPAVEQGLLSKDIQRACQSALLYDMPPSVALAALSAGVEVEFPASATIPRVVANDLVGYIALDGIIDCGGKRTVGQGAVLFPESLVGVWDGSELPVAREPARLLRVRADDFAEVCSDPTLGVLLYQRVASMLARAAVDARRDSNLPPHPVSASMPPNAEDPKSRDGTPSSRKPPPRSGK